MGDTEWEFEPPIIGMPETRLYLVVVQDTVLQGNGYLVRATDEDAAKASVKEGMYIEETKAEILDTINSEVVSVTEIASQGPGQDR